MPFSKIAFIARDHRRITAHIMGDRFDPRLFKLVNDYIDQEKGRDHRERHGHNLEAEKYIRETWGDAGVEIFRIHIISDLLYDDLGPVVMEAYRKNVAGEFQPPYYDAASRDNRPHFPIAIATEAECRNCGSRDIDINTWFCPLCVQCRTARNLESCVQCRNLFAKQDRVTSPDNPGKFICPVCKADKNAE